MTFRPNIEERKMMLTKKKNTRSTPAVDPQHLKVKE